MTSSTSDRLDLWVDEASPKQSFVMASGAPGPQLTVGTYDQIQVAVQDLVGIYVGGLWGGVGAG